MSSSELPARMTLAPQVRPRGIVEIGHRVCVVCPVLAPDAACLHPGLFFARQSKVGYDREATAVVNRLQSLILHLDWDAMILAEAILAATAVGFGCANKSCKPL
jgi:hypothetical protein